MLQEQAEQKMISTLRDRGLDPRFENAQLSDFSEGVRKSLPEDRGAFITGPCGTGKTHLLSALLRSTSAHSAIVVGASGELVLRHPDAYPLMTSIHEILLDVRSTFGRDTRITEAEVIDDITSVPVLLLDDLGTEKPTEWALSTIYLVVDRRYRNQLQTYFSSNLSLSELSGHLGDRITSRIAGMTKVIKLTGKDRRLSPKP
jgi:DNA replication protein DnaC